MIAPDYLTAFNTRYIQELQTIPLDAYHMHLEDGDLPDFLVPTRTRYPTPAVFPMANHAVVITAQWQFFIAAINHAMSLQYISAIFGSRRAFCNRTGFNDPDLPPRANYILRKDLGAELPTFDKVRTCARSVMAGVVDGEVLIVDMLDGTKEPPLKPGLLYPTRVEAADEDDYVYTPRTHPHLFFAANIVTGDGRYTPFPNGGLYDWFPHGPVTFLPHVAARPVRYSLNYLRRVDGPVSPYS